MTMKKTTTAIISVVTIASFSAGATSFSSYEKDINSEQALIKEIKVGEKIYESTFYSRKPIGLYKNLKNADYVELWHGKDQTPYSLLNISGFTQKNADDQRRLVLMGVEQTEFNNIEAAKLSRLLTIIKQPYLKVTPHRRQYTVGFDLGVSGAYLSACHNDAFGAILSSGGISETETCEPTNLRVMYSINSGDQLFPKDKDSMFTSKAPYSLTNRLDGIRTEKKFIKLMSCNSPPLTESGRGASVRSYSCNKGNELIVLEHETEHHQWNGYLLVDKNTFNQYGAPYKIPLMDWIYNKMNLK